MKDLFLTATPVGRVTVRVAEDSYVTDEWYADYYIVRYTGNGQTETFERLYEALAAIEYEEDDNDKECTAVLKVNQWREPWTNANNSHGLTPITNNG